MMKRKLWFSVLIILIIILQFIIGCKKEHNLLVTKDNIPMVTTQPATFVQLSSGILNGTVNANYLSAIVTFEYGTTISYNSTATAVQSPVTGNINSYVSAYITGLTVNTTYHFRVVAENLSGISYGNDMVFTTLNKVADSDSNIYNTVAIGSQIWMAENLKTTKYQEGSEIPNVTDNTTWSNLTSGAFCWYDNDSATYKITNGALYNYYAVTDSRNLCPAGWHIPDNGEWNILETYLGGSGMAGGKMKEAGAFHWASPNTGADNTSGFSGLPGGYRSVNGIFLDSGYYGFWWSSTEYSASGAWVLYLGYDKLYTYKGYDVSKTIGFSVRCIRN